MKHALFINSLGGASQLGLVHTDQQSFKIVGSVSFNLTGVHTIPVPEEANYFLGFSANNISYVNDANIQPSTGTGNRLFNNPRNIVAVNPQIPFKIFGASSGWTTLYWLEV